MKKQAIFISLLAGTLSAQAATISISTPTPSVDLGAELEFDIRGDFSDLQRIVGGSLNVAFDASILEVKTSTINDLDWAFGTNAGDFSVPGEVSNMAFGSFPAKAPGEYLIGNIIMKAIGAGSSSLTLSEGESAFSDGSDFTPTFGSATVTVVDPSVVPVPAAVWLFGSAIFGLMATGRRK